MTRLRFNSRSGYLLALESGVLLALSFPRYGHPAVAWIALAPLLIALGQGSLARAFGLGVVTGVVYFGGTIYWITHVMAVYGDLPRVVAVLINAGLIAYLALFPALFAILVRRSMIAFGPTALVASPLVWVATELGRTYLFTGFPWVLLGYSQARVLPVAQLASLFGVYGVSALVANVNAGIAIAALHWARVAPGLRVRGAAGAAGRARSDLGRSYGPAIAAVAVALVVAVWGSRRAGKAEWTRAGDAVRVGLVQGNVDQSVKMDTTADATAIFAEYLRLTRQAIDRGAQVVLWPESSIPFRLEEDTAAAEELRALARQARVPVLVGSDQIDRRVRPPTLYNAAFMIEANGSTGGVYRKIHLVPFGEYVPRPFFFAGRLVEAVSDFSPGTEVALLPVSGHLMSTAICYEIVYPDLVRQSVTHGSELVSTITNDAWFGDSSAPYQHFEQASMRAIESGRYLVRAANTGISGIVDPYGRVLAESPLFERTVVVGTVRYLHTTTFYALHGDLFAYASVGATLVLLLQSRTWRLSTN